MRQDQRIALFPSATETYCIMLAPTWRLEGKDHSISVLLKQIRISTHKSLVCVTLRIGVQYSVSTHNVYNSCSHDIPTVLRPEEEGGVHNKIDETKILTEGKTEFNQTYIKSVSTEIIIDRTFRTPGYIYNLTLMSYNMHDITAPNIIMRWHIECASPVLPQHWSLEYEPNIHTGEHEHNYPPVSDIPAKVLSSTSHSRFSPMLPCPQDPGSMCMVWRV